ncbi:MAG: hypothetical protein ABIO44_00870, partial [Saprospiraceae bacterium]
TIGKIKKTCGLVQDTRPFWKGVEIGSNGGRGFVYFTNNGTMEHSYSGLFNAFGCKAFVTANNSKMLNNRTALDMLSKDRLGTYLYFNDCEFSLNTNYLGSDLHHQIILGNGFASFNNCSIINGTSYLPDNKCGVYENGTRLTIKNSPKISGFYYGVQALGLSGTYLIENNHFEKFKIGLSSEGVNNFLLNNNDFKAGAWASTASSIGVYLSTATGFSIRNNHFINTSTGSFSTGIQIRYTHLDDENYISKDNNFIGLKYGIFCSQFMNRKLYLTCNDFINCKEDIYIYPSASVGSIQKFQDQPAGNTFTQSGQNSNYKNESSSNIKYWYNGLVQIENPQIVNNVDKVQVNNPGPRCFQTPIDPTCCPELTHDQNYIDLVNQEISIKSNLATLLDNGNTLTLSNQLVNLDSSNATTFLSSIQGISPNVSSQLIKAIWIRNDLFTGQERYELVVNNPLVLLEAEVRELIEIPISGINSTMVSNLRNLTLPLSGQRFNLSMQLENISGNKNNLVKSMVNYHLTSEEEQIDLTLKWLDRLGTLSAKMDATLLCLNNGNFSMVPNYLTQIQTIGTNSSSSVTQSEVNEFITFINFLLPIYQSGRYVGELNISEQNS